MRLHLLGTRGSMPATGPQHVRYGGDTSSVAVTTGDGPPRLVLDAGTGLARLERLTAGAAFEGSILLTHLHWDHLFGLPFCRVADHPAARVDLRMPTGDRDAETLLEMQMSPPSFPIRPSELRGRWRFLTISEGSHRLEGYDVEVAEVAHKGGLTFGYRVSDGESAFAYLPDHDPMTTWATGADVDRLRRNARDLIDGVDVLIHDAQLSTEDRPALDHIGHATVDEAIALAIVGQVGRLVLFHHGPRRTDDELDALRDELVAPLPLGLARDGDVVDLTSIRLKEVTS